MSSEDFPQFLQMNINRDTLRTKERFIYL
jgi:hypothetical protein